MKPNANPELDGEVLEELDGVDLDDDGRPYPPSWDVLSRGLSEYCFDPEDQIPF